MFYDKFWLNGTATELWPTKLTSAHIGDLSADQAHSSASCKLATLKDVSRQDIQDSTIILPVILASISGIGLSLKGSRRFLA